MNDTPDLKRRLDSVFLKAKYIKRLGCWNKEKYPACVAAYSEYYRGAKLELQNPLVRKKIMCKA